MAGKVIDATLQFKDKFTGKMDKAIQKMELQQKSVSKLGNSIGRSGKNLVRKGELLAKGITAPIAAIGVASVKTAADFEDSMAKVSTIANSNKVPIDKMRESILKLSNQTGISSNLIAEDVYNAISAGQKTKDAVKFVEKSSKLAKAGFADSASALDILTTIMNSYGFSSKKVGKVSDMLIQTQNKGKTTVAQLASSMGKVVPTAKAYGVGLDQVCAGYVKMTANGISTAESTTYMNSMLNELGKSSTGIAKTLKKETGKSFKDLMKSGYSVADCLEIVNNSAKKQGLQFTDMFSSSEAAKAGLNILGDSANSFNKTAKEMNKSTGATDKAFEKMDTTSNKINKTVNRVKNAATKFGNTLITMITPYIDLVIKKVNKLTKWLSSLNENQQKTIIKIAGIAAAIGPMIIVVGKVIKTAGSAVKTIGTIGKTISDVWKGVGLLGKIFKGVGKLIKGGVGLVINAFKLLGLKGMAVIFIMALIAGAAYIVYKNWDKIKAFFIGLGEKFREFGEKVKNAFLSIKVRCVSTVTSLIGKVKEFVERVKSNGGILGAVFQNIGNYVNGVKKTFGGIVTFIKGIFTLNWKTAWQGIVQTFGGIFSTLGSYVKAPINGVIGLINGVIDRINSLSFTVPDWVKGIGGKTFGANLGKIPFLYKGTDFFAGGPAVINDRGAEIVNLPRGTQVIPHDRSLQIAFNRGKQSSGGSFRIEKLADTIIVREDADIDRIAEALAEKLERTRLNMGDVA